MNNVFEVPPVIPAIKIKKERKKRIYTAEQKQKFVERMAISREIRRKKDKADKEALKNSQPVQIKQPITEFQQPISQPQVPQYYQQATPQFDYSHFNNLSNNIQSLTQTLTNLRTPPPVKELPPPPPPVKELPPPPPVQESPPPPPPTPEEPPRQIIPQKEKVWNCGLMKYVYI
jgi:hypothetical protein